MTATASLPTDDSNLATQFTTQQYVDVADNDTIYVCQNMTYPDYAVFLFKQKYTGIASFTISWNGKSSVAPLTHPVTLQVYNRITPGWVTLQTNNTAGVDEEFNLGGFIDTDYGDYYDVDFYVTCRVYQGTS